MLHNFFSDVSKVTAHARLQQQPIKYRRKTTSVGLSKNTDEKDKEKSNNTGICKAFCNTSKRGNIKSVLPNNMKIRITYIGVTFGNKFSVKVRTKINMNMKEKWSLQVLILSKSATK